MDFLNRSVLIMGKHIESGTSRLVLLRSTMRSLSAVSLSQIEFEKNNNEETRAGNTALVFIDGFDKGSCCTRRYDVGVRPAICHLSDLYQIQTLLQVSRAGVLVAGVSAHIDAARSVVLRVATGQEGTGGEPRERHNTSKQDKAGSGSTPNSRQEAGEGPRVELNDSGVQVKIK